jgi:hypothetical protein
MKDDKKSTPKAKTGRKKNPAKAYIKRIKSSVLSSDVDIKEVLKQVNGRPPKLSDPNFWNDETKETILDCYAQGHPDVEVCVRIGISEKTLSRWCDKKGDYYNAEFCRVVGKGKELSKAWWFKKDSENLKSKDFNTALYKHAMSHRFGVAERVEVKATDEFKGSDDLNDEIAKQFESDY